MMPRVLEPEYMDTDEEADGYDAMDHSGPNGSFLARLRELGARGRMLDLGCGPGHVAVLVAESIPDSRVVALDAAKTMLAHAERHRLRSKAAARIELALADAKGLAYPDASFDCVFSNTVLHHIPDPLPFLREAWRVLRPGGVFLVRDLFRPETPERALELVRLHASKDTPYQRELFRASLHAALTTAEFRRIADQAGIGSAEIVIDSDRHHSLQTRGK